MSGTYGTTTLVDGTPQVLSTEYFSYADIIFTTGSNPVTIQVDNEGDNNFKTLQTHNLPSGSTVSSHINVLKTCQVLVSGTASIISTWVLYG